MQKKILALLPMKGNSERVVNKNLKNFNGFPLYHRVMKTLIASKYIEKIIVNTDSEKIKNDVLLNFKNDVIVIDRPESIIGDFVSMNEIIKYDISCVDADYYIQTHSTNPLLRTKSIDQAIELMFSSEENKSNDSVFSVTKLQTRLYDIKGTPYNHDPNILLRTQDLKPLFEENSNFYIFTKKSFSNAGNKRIGVRPFMFEIDKIEAIDIDEPQDFIIAEALHKIV